mmetsp:Transcript_13868/g.43813  ORF Transcript_13868/g.43813 Transcript_13868/m.43813 type:complete len:210 (-) Transcript_13868:389-1018(-)
MTKGLEAEVMTRASSEGWRAWSRVLGMALKMRSGRKPRCSCCQNATVSKASSSTATRSNFLLAVAEFASSAVASPRAVEDRPRNDARSMPRCCRMTCRLASETRSVQGAISEPSVAQARPVRSRTHSVSQAASDSAGAGSRGGLSEDDDAAGPCAAATTAASECLRAASCAASLRARRRLSAPRQTRSDLTSAMTAGIPDTVRPLLVVS